MLSNNFLFTLHLTPVLLQNLGILKHVSVKEIYDLFIPILSYIDIDYCAVLNQYSEQKSADDLHNSFVYLTPVKLLFFFNLPALLSQHELLLHQTLAYCGGDEDIGDLPTFNSQVGFKDITDVRALD